MYEVAVIHICLCNCSILNFLIYEENFDFLFYQYILAAANKNRYRIPWHFYCRFKLISSSPCTSLRRHILYLPRDIARDNEVAVTAVLGDGREEEPITVIALCCEPYHHLFSRCQCSTILSLKSFNECRLLLHFTIIDPEQDNLRNGITYFFYICSVSPFRALHILHYEAI